MKAGWQNVKLGELCAIELGKTPSRSDKALWDEKRETGNVWLSIADLLNAEDGIVLDSKEYISNQGAAVSKVVRSGTLLVSFKLTLGRLAFAGRDLFTNEAIAALSIFNEKELSKKFLFYFLHFFDWRKAAENDVKLKGMTLNKAKLKEIEVYFPPPNDQQRIVAILDEAFDGIATARANAEQNLQNARAIFESHLQAVFSQKGEGWYEKSLDQAVDSKCSLSYGIVQPGEDQAEGLPIVRPTDLGARTIELDGLKRIAPSLADSYRRTTLRGNDILLCVRGSTGMVSIASETLAGGNVTRGIVPIHFDDALIEQSFGYYLMRSGPVQQQIREQTYGAALMQINIRDLRNLVLSIPPRPSQSALVHQFDSLLEEAQRLESIYQRKLESIDELKKSLLHQAFTGNL